MDTATKDKITIKASINAPIALVWKCWTSPEDIVHWNAASDDWFTPKATNDIRKDGTFNYTMAAKDGSFSFDFEGSYTKVEPNKLIAYTLFDDRKVEISFTEIEGIVEISETFEAEDIHTIEQQRTGWQAILNNFEKHCEAKYGER